LRGGWARAFGLLLDEVVDVIHRCLLKGLEQRLEDRFESLGLVGRGLRLRRGPSITTGAHYVNRLSKEKSAFAEQRHRSSTAVAVGAVAERLSSSSETEQGTEMLLPPVTA